MYQKCTMDIDEMKKGELKNGSTTKCKNQIDNLYSKLSQKEIEIEVELYKRKSSLLNEIKVNSSLNYDMIISGGGAFLGAILGYYLQETIQFIIELVTRIKEGSLFQLSPKEIVYGDSFIGWIVIFLIFLGMFFWAPKIKEKLHENDELYVFKIDMDNYEIQKIDELLKKL